MAPKPSQITSSIILRPALCEPILTQFRLGTYNPTPQYDSTPTVRANPHTMTLQERGPTNHAGICIRNPSYRWQAKPNEHASAALRMPTHTPSHYPATNPPAAPTKPQTTHATTYTIRHAPSSPKVTRDKTIAIRIRRHTQPTISAASRVQRTRICRVAHADTHNPPHRGKPNPTNTHL